MTTADAAGGRYTRVAVALHWTIAAAILFNLAFGFFMEGLPMPWRAVTIFLHVSAGMTVLALTVARVAWRATHRPPAFLPGMRAWERLAAHGVHAALYVAMLAMPVLGWAIVSANPPADATWPARPPRPPMKIWGVIPMPRIAPLVEIGRTAAGGARQKALHDAFARWHGAGGWIMVALLLLHVGGALKHQLVDRQPELARIGRGRRRTRRGGDGADPWHDPENGRMG